MNLLKPEDIKKDRSESAEEAMGRARALSAEESRLARAINQARADAAQEIEIIQNDFDAFKADIKKEKDNLISEVSGLENRKAEALKPIGPIKEAAAIALVEAEKVLAEAKEFKLTVANDHEKNQEFAEYLADQKGELASRQDKVTESERAAEHEKLRVQNSATDLGNKWADYHRAVHQLNGRTQRVEEREQIVVADNIAIEARRKAQDSREQELNAQETNLRSRYIALEAAQKEILNKQNDGSPQG